MTGPFFDLLPWCAAAIGGCWVLSVLTKNYSWVDRFWSIAPPLYVIAIAWSERFASARLNLMAALAVLWGVRLTYNFARKGGYRLRDEDYRWAVLREKLGPVGFQALNATFIAPYQNILLLLIVAPAHTAWLHKSTPLGVGDVAAALLFLALLAGETIADEQQWRFHQRKATLARAGVTADPPFCTDGLFRFSRHPNFFCEISIWWAFYLFAVSASGELLHWTVLGAVLLTLLFQGSTAFTESITAKKYPSYRRYQASTSRLVPWFPRKS